MGKKLRADLEKLSDQKRNNIMKNLEFFNRNQARDFINKNKPMAIIPTGSVELSLIHI